MSVALIEKTKSMDDLIWVDFLEGHNIKCGMERVSALIVDPRVGGSRVRQGERKSKISG